MSILFYLLEKNWMVTLSFWRVRNILLSTFLIIIIAPNNFWELGNFQERRCKLASQVSQNKTKQQSTYLQLERQKPKASLCKSCHPMQAMEKSKKLHLRKENNNKSVQKKKEDNNKQPFGATHWKKNKMAKQKQQYLDESKGINNNNHHQSKKFYSHHKNKKG